MRDLNSTIITVDHTDDELKNIIVSLTRLIRAHGKPFVLFISGYDNDQRELWEIPEVQSLCERLVNSGFISLLETGLPTGAPYALTAFRVWKIAKGEMRRTLMTSREEGSQFFKELMECNAKCDALTDSRSDEPEMHAIRFSGKCDVNGD